MSRLTVAKCLTLPALQGTRVLAGATGLDRVIECATVMEVPNVTRWLRGNELVITSLYALREDPDEQVRLIEGLDRVGIAALLIKPKVFVERLPDRMLQEADARGLPVLELPVETPYTDVLAAVMAEVFRRSSVRRFEADLVADLLAGVIASPEELATRAAEVGWNPRGGALAAVLQIEPPPGPTLSGGALYRLCDRVVDEARAAVRADNGLVAGSGSRVRVVWAAGGDGAPARPAAARAALQSVQNDLKRRRIATLSVAIGPPVAGVAGLPESYRAACRYLEVSRRVWGPGRVVTPDELGVYTLLETMGASGPGGARVSLDPGIRRLLEHDAQHNGQLLKTLRCVLDEGGHLRRAANRLFVHFKTVQYRMGRIREITGWDLRNADLRLAIELQLRWLDLYGPPADTIVEAPAGPLAPLPAPPGPPPPPGSPLPLTNGTPAPHEASHKEGSLHRR